MAKIKFNLNFGGEQVRTLEDLRENFSIEDVLDVYYKGLLVKWLDVHNHKDKLEKVKAIQATDARGILSELIKIFGISDDPEEIRESLSVLDYLEERKKAHEDMKAHGIPDYEKVKKERDELLKQNEELREMRDSITPEIEAPASTTQAEAPKTAKKSYEALVQGIIDNHQDLNHIYDCLDIITTDYPDILREKYSELFNRLYESRPHTIIPLFAHHDTRPYYAIEQSKLSDAIMGVNYCDNSGKKTQIFETRYSSGSFSSFCPGVSEVDEIREKINFLKTLQSFASNAMNEGTEKYLYIKVAKRKISTGNWTTIESPNKKFMPFYQKNGEAFFVGGTYMHHKVTIGGFLPSFGTVEMKSNYLPVTLPIFEGLDVAGEAIFGNDVHMAYIEAH